MSEENQVVEQSTEQQTTASDGTTTGTTAPPDVQAPQTLRDMIPEDLRMEPSLQDFKDVGSLAKSYVHANKMIGNSIRIPADDASDEAKEKFYNKLNDIPDIIRITPDNKEQVFSKLGKPESADGYEVNLPEELGNVDADLLARSRQAAFDMNLTQEQANKWIEYEARLASDSVAQVYTPPEEAEAALRKVWGDDYDNRFAGAQLAAQQLQERYPEDYAKLMGGPLQNNPVLLDLLAKSGKDLLSEGAGSVPGKMVSYGLSPDEAKAKINEKRSDEGFMKAYYNQSHPNHRDAVAQMDELYRKANPS